MNTFRIRALMLIPATGLMLLGGGITTAQASNALPACSQPTPTTPTSSPTSATPVSVLGTAASTTTPVSVLGTAATANPLPVGAAAGQANTSGQFVAGGLAALAALLALGTGFVLRRRHGVV